MIFKRCPENLQNVAFRASTAEALLWVGRTGEAQQIGRTIQSFGGVAAPVAAVFGGGLDAQVALVQGDPTMAARILGSMVASMHGVDASGLRSWATAQLRWALAWAGQDPELDERIVPPPQGQLLGPRIRLFECMAAAEQGSLRVARRQALELADSAEAHGHYSTALHAVHLAGRIQVTQNLAERATGIASRVDGDVAGAVQDHLSALFTVNGAGLEKVGVTFESLGHLAYADEAFTNAAAAHRQRGKNTGAGRCAAEAHRLRSAGVMPTFAARRPEGTAISLTPRETEVVRLAATGLTNREVSAALGLSTRTVETHLQHAYTKLGINDRTQVSARLGESGRK